LNKLLHNLAQNLNTLQKKLPTSQYELDFKCPYAEGLKDINLSILVSALVFEMFAIMHTVITAV